MTRQWEDIPEEDQHALLDELVAQGLLAHNDDGSFYVSELGEQYVNARLAFAGGELPANRWVGGEVLSDLEALAKRKVSIELDGEAGPEKRDSIALTLDALKDDLALLGVEMRYSIEEVQS